MCIRSYENPIFLAGSIFILLTAHTAFSNVTVRVDTDIATTLSLGLPLPDQTVATAGASLRFKLVLQPGVLGEILTITLSGGIGDADLYVRKDAEVSTSQSDYSSRGSGNNEKIQIRSPSAGKWKVQILCVHLLYSVLILRSTGN